MTSKRFQRCSGMLVDVAELMMVVWMVNIVVLKSFSISLDFCPSGFSRHFSDIGVSGMGMC